VSHASKRDDLIKGYMNLDKPVTREEVIKARDYVEDSYGKSMAKEFENDFEILRKLSEEKTNG
jgi:SET domain-containing protein